MADAGGGAPLGEDLGVGADGGVETLDQRAAFLNEGAGLGGVADVCELVVGLFAAFAGDFAEIGLEGGDEVRGEEIGDELGDGGGVFEVLEEIVGRGEDLRVGVVSEAEAGGEAGLLEIDGAGGARDGFEIVPDLVEEMFQGPGCRAGRGPRD